MKKIVYILSVMFLFLIQSAQAQNIGDLDGIFYQAVALDDEPKELIGIDIEAKPLFNREIGVLFTITKGVNGEEQWKEEHVTTTDKYGLFTLVIGRDSESSTSYTKLSTIYARLLDMPWIDADQFLKVEISTKNDGNYKMVSNQKFMAVPYAFYTDDIADDAITTEKILNEEILADDIATGAVETSEILDATILNEDIAEGTVDLTAKVTNVLPVNNGGTGLDGSVATNGQVLIGNSTTGDFDLATITAGTGINITNGAGSITIESPPVGVSSNGSAVIETDIVIPPGEAYVTTVIVSTTATADINFGNIVLASIDKKLDGCMLTASVESENQGEGNVQVSVVIYNPNRSSGPDKTVTIPGSTADPTNIKILGIQ